MDRLQPDSEGLGVARADVVIEAIVEDARSSSKCLLKLSQSWVRIHCWRPILPVFRYQRSAVTCKIRGACWACISSIRSPRCSWWRLCAVRVRADLLSTGRRPSSLRSSDSKITLKRSDSGYTFVNFNFTIFDDEETYTEPEPLTPEEKKQRRKKVLAFISEKNSREVERIKKMGRVS